MGVITGLSIRASDGGTVSLIEVRSVHRFSGAGAGLSTRTVRTGVQRVRWNMNIKTSLIVGTPGSESFG